MGQAAECVHGIALAVIVLRQRLPGSGDGDGQRKGPCKHGRSDMTGKQARDSTRKIDRTWRPSERTVVEELMELTGTLDSSQRSNGLATLPQCDICQNSLRRHSAVLSKVPPRYSQHGQSQETNLLHPGRSQHVDSTVAGRNTHRTPAPKEARHSTNSGGSRKSL